MSNAPINNIWKKFQPTPLNYSILESTLLYILLLLHLTEEGHKGTGRYIFEWQFTGISSFGS